MKGTTCCCICGKPLTDPSSIAIGMGKVCAGKYNLKSSNSKKNNPTFDPQSDYSYSIIDINGEKVGIVIDKDTTGFMSVTNNIDNVCSELRVKNVIYRDSEGVWDFWSKKTGFKSLALKGVSETNLDKAINTAKKRFFPIGLFATI